jgi:plastocyanin
MNISCKRGSTNIILVILILLALLGFSALIIYLNNASNPADRYSVNDMKMHGGAINEYYESGTIKNKVREFTIQGFNFGYSIKVMRVKKGEVVHVNLDVTDGFHDWVIDEFSARTEKVKAGSTTSVEFIPNKIGEFEYYCSVGSHRQMGMIGKLIVE